MEEDVKGFAAGWFAGCAGLVASYPLDTIRVRMQTQRGIHVGVVHHFKDIVKDEKVNDLFKGMTYPLIGQAAINAVVFGVESMVCGRLNEESESQLSIKNSVLAGMCAGAVQTIIACPMELVKIKMQNQGIGQPHISWTRMKLGRCSALQKSNLFKDYRGPLALTQDILHKEGIRGFFRGWWLTLFREVPQYGIYFGSYAWIRIKFAAITNTSPENLGVLHLSLAGGITGILTWSWYPVDVIKSRFQYI